MNQDSQRRWEYGFGPLCPALEGPVGRAAEGIDRRGADGICDAVDDPPGPAIQRMGRAVARLRRLRKHGPHLAAHIADEDGRRGRRATIQRRQSILCRRAKAAAMAEARGSQQVRELGKLHGADAILSIKYGSRNNQSSPMDTETPRSEE